MAKNTESNLRTSISYITLIFFQMNIFALVEGNDPRCGTGFAILSFLMDSFLWATPAFVYYLCVVGYDVGHCVVDALNLFSF